MKKATSSEEQRSQAHGDSTTGKRKAATIKASASNTGKSDITLTQHNGVHRVDSRLLAKQLGNQHESVMKSIKAYPADFEELGVLRFEIGKPPTGSKGGRPEEYALLNEDQCYLLLTYSRNTLRVRKLKISLIKAFREARYGAACQTLLARKKEASRNGRGLARYRYDKPGLERAVVYTQLQMSLGLEDATNDSRK